MPLFLKPISITPAQATENIFKRLLSNEMRDEGIDLGPDDFEFASNTRSITLDVSTYNGLMQAGAFSIVQSAVKTLFGDARMVSKQAGHILIYPMVAFTEPERMGKNVESEIGEILKVPTEKLARAASPADILALHQGEYIPALTQMADIIYLQAKGHRSDLSALDRLGFVTAVRDSLGEPVAELLINDVTLRLKRERDQDFDINPRPRTPQL